MSELELRFFGPPSVRRDGADVRFDTRKATALLALLAVTGRDHGRDALAGLLWPELDRSRARGALRRTLSVATAAGPALVVLPDVVRLDPERSWCDVQEFRTMAAAHDAASWNHAAELAEQAFLEGFALRDSPAFEDWQIATADGLRDLASQNLGRLTEDAVARRDLAAAVGFARRRVLVEPLSEPAHADFIRATAWSGDRPGAVKAYRALVRLLDRELGVPPLPETVALHESIRTDTLPLPDQLPRAHTAQTVPGLASDRPATVGQPGLTGREELLGKLDDAWRDAAVHGCGVGLTGEPGIGKTALALEFALRVAHAGKPVLRLAAHQAERGLAYAAANDLVSGMLAARPDLAARLGSTANPLGLIAVEVDSQGAGGIRNPGDLRQLYESVRAALAEFATAGALIVVDDAHLLDPSSAALLAYCVRRSPAGLLIVATWSTGEARGALPDAIAEAGRPLLVPPLELDGVAALVGESELDPSEVLRRTRGVPLLVQEYAVSGPGLGTAVRDVVATRFEAVSPTTRQVVAAAAVIGTVADPELLRVACGRDESETVDAIEEAISRGLLVERSDRPGYDLPHDLVRDLALSWLSLARTRLLHGRIAEVLIRRHAIDPLSTPAGAVARHLADAGHDEDATDWYLTAAGEASRLYAHAEALTQLNAARSLGHRPLDVHEAMGATLVRLGRYADALVSFDRACALAEDDPRRQAAIEHATGGVYDRLGDPALAIAHLEAARDLMKGTGHARVLCDLALALHRSGDEDEAARTAEEAARASGGGDETVLALADNVLGVIAERRGDHAAAVERLRSALGHARATDDIDIVIATLNNLSHALRSADDPTGAFESAREALDLAEHQGDRHRLAVLHSHVADLLHEAGRDEEAIGSLMHSAEAFGDVQEAQLRPGIWMLAEW